MHILKHLFCIPVGDRDRLFRERVSGIRFVHQIDKEREVPVIAHIHLFPFFRSHLFFYLQLRKCEVIEADQFKPALIDYILYVSFKPAYLLFYFRTEIYLSSALLLVSENKQLEASVL